MMFLYVGEKPFTPAIFAFWGVNLVKWKCWCKSHLNFCYSLFHCMSVYSNISYLEIVAFSVFKFSQLSLVSWKLIITQWLANIVVDCEYTWHVHVYYLLNIYQALFVIEYSSLYPVKMMYIAKIISWKNLWFNGRINICACYSW